MIHFLFYSTSQVSFFFFFLARLYYIAAYFNHILKIYTPVLAPKGKRLMRFITAQSGSHKVLNALIIKLHFVHCALKITSNSCCSLLATDGFSMAHYKEGRMASEQDEWPLLGNCLTNRVERSFSRYALFYPSWQPAWTCWMSIPALQQRLASQTTLNHCPRGSQPLLHLPAWEGKSPILTPC